MRAIGNFLQTNTPRASGLRPMPVCASFSIGAFGCVIALLLMLGGCSKQLYGSLNESAANQVVSALRLEGVSADKASAGERLWNVTVADDQFAQAVQILERRNLPPQPFEGLGQVFKKESLVSTPTEERARLIHAMSQELERSLMEMDDVLVARVHPVILPHDPLNPKRANASASVLIKYRAGVDMSGREGMIRALVSAGVEGLAYDDVRVLMVSADKRANSIERSAIPGGIPVQFWAVLCGVLATLLVAYAALHWRDTIGRAVQTIRERSSSRRNQDTKRSSVKSLGEHA